MLSLDNHLKPIMTFNHPFCLATDDRAARLFYKHEINKDHFEL